MTYLYISVFLHGGGGAAIIWQICEKAVAVGQN